MKIGIRVQITQVTDDMIHNLFEVYNIIEFDEKQYPTQYKSFLKDLKESSIKLSENDI